MSMSLGHAFALLIRPRTEWAAIRDRRYGVASSFLLHTALFALIPAVAGYLGTTRTGWQIGDRRRGATDRGERTSHRGPLLPRDGGRDLLRRVDDPLDEPHLRGEPAARTVLRARHLHGDPAVPRRR